MENDTTGVNVPPSGGIFPLTRLRLNAMADCLDHEEPEIQCGASTFRNFPASGVMRTSRPFELAVTHGHYRSTCECGRRADINEIATSLNSKAKNRATAEQKLVVQKSVPRISEFVIPQVIK